MDRANSTSKKATQITATELCASGQESPARQLGRRLRLEFIGAKDPKLDRIEFLWSQERQIVCWQRGKTRNFSWKEVSQALSLIFLEYLCANLRNAPPPFFFSGAKTGSPAASLGNAIYQDKPGIRDLFIEVDEKGGVSYRIKDIFEGDNVHGKQSRDRRISINEDTLPPDCIEVSWDARDAVTLTRLAELGVLLNRIQKSLGMESTVPDVEALEKELDAAVKPVQPTPPSVPASAAVEAKCSKPTATTQLALPQSLLSSFEKMADAASKFFERRSAPRTQPTSAAKSASESSATQPEAKNPTKPVQKDGLGDEKAQLGLETSPSFISAPVRPIDSDLFKISASGSVWDNTDVLLEFGAGDDEVDQWTLRNACEGTLILGTTGSGKTTGSGATIAGTFLENGFGGLVLSAKEGEAKYWRSLCERHGRKDDFIAVQLDGPWKCNLLAYEAQRPQRGSRFSENLLGFFRTLLRMLSRQDQAATNEQFWQTATDQLMRSLFDAFLLARRPITITELVAFAISAPSKEGEEPKQFCAEVLSKARALAQSDQDKIDYQRIWEYWTAIFPNIPSKTRYCITLGFQAMADMFRSRGVYQMLSTETTFTPEMILSGKIVVLDLPIKDYRQVGLLVQSAFKYLFQLAVESRSDSGGSRRPVFLWEDEAQYFLSDYDSKFQQTARAYRVATVLISQNLSNFYEQFGNRAHDLVNSVFSNLNTQIFHANNDTVTNEWAAKRFGTHLRTLYNSSTSSRPASIFETYLFPDQGNTTISSSQVREYFVQPHEFAELRMGGPDFDYTIDAYIYSTGQPWKATGKQFRMLTFHQT